MDEATLSAHAQPDPTQPGAALPDGSPGERAGHVPWAQSTGQVLAELGTSADGLTTDDAARLLAQHGANRLPPPERDPLWKRILVHFDDVLIYVLLVAAVLKAVVGDWVDFAVILAVAIINAGIGFVQEGKAESALASLRTMLSTHAEALRYGQWSKIDADDLVPGDIVRVRAGDRVPADVRVLDATNLRIEESALTGESVPAEKHPGAVEPDAGVGDRTSMMFSSTLVAAGQGSGVVVATGQHTEIGRIQTMMSEVTDVKTPLTRQLDRFGKVIAVAILGLGAFMVLVGRLVHDQPVDELLSAGIGFAVAAVPEGLPALVTITLALGVQQMARRRAITRKLPAVETLGSVTTICSDKTGTLTRNEMTARTVLTADLTIDVEGVGYAPEGRLTAGGAEVVRGEHVAFDALTDVMALCNDARVEQGDDGRWGLVGEPTEGALAVLGLKAGAASGEWERLAVLPFESATKYMATLDRRGEESAVIHVKGAPDRVLERCSAQTSATGGREPLDRDMWLERIDELGSRGLRVLAAARKPAEPGVTTVAADDVADGLELCGLVGIVDPPRPEAIEAIAECHAAGIGVKMITGDHAGTAFAIAQEMGIARPGARVLTGADLEELTTSELRKVVRDVDVYARTSPEHKIRIVAALQSHGEIVAMTGDGVNDAPALTQADVGVAMGIKGTEVTKDAAEVVLADDNFATIERAVEEGRRIYDNIRKSVLFLLPTNGAQSLVVLVAVLAGLTMPLLPVQVLWINMITAVTLSLALAYEQAEPGIMRRPPRDSRSGILDAAAVNKIVVASLAIGAAALGVFMWLERAGEPLAVARTTAVTTLALAQLAYLFSCRFLDRSSLTPAVLRGNRVLWLSAGALLVLQGVFVYAPFMHVWFSSASIGAAHWGVAVAVSVGVLLVVELAKVVSRGLTKRRH
ncbi:HAD-IC family P-type ATPase [Sanguibacter massiliensis]|uniref:HAD-IC family P-type ATPase n=1 Tax=Sanguibacter massiliensis TaxID=1973217 RepID=UPI000C840675|nr:HAD-IC family P-type ATPase [Sanguibacter massiliensis]